MSLRVFPQALRQGKIEIKPSTAVLYLSRSGCHTHTHATLSAFQARVSQLLLIHSYCTGMTGFAYIGSASVATESELPMALQFLFVSHIGSASNNTVQKAVPTS